MGDTFANLQVFPAKPYAASARAKLERRISGHLKELGFRLRGGRGQTREILIGPVQAGSWIAIYDSALALSDARVLDDLGLALSVNGLVVAVGVSVYDSDLLELSFYRNGSV